MKGNLERAASAAEKARDDFISKLTEVPNAEQISSLLEIIVGGGGVRPERAKISTQLCNDAVSSLLVAVVASLTQLPVEDVLPSLTSVADERERQAKSFDEDAKATRKEVLTTEVQELTARKWLSQQSDEIGAEIERLKRTRALREAQGLTHTRALSEKKAELAEILVSEAFRQRFSDELKRRASRLRVIVDRGQTSKGQVFHQIKLKDAKQPRKTADILSEGEFRIVSIAAFLADVEGKAGNAAFVFHDPISSLDQPFEEATAARLISLAKTRQVIASTHRLSMMVLIDDAAEKEKVEVNKLSIRSESWGAGEPDQTPIWAKKPESVITGLLGGRLAQAKRTLNEDWRSSYEPVAKAMCSEIRIAIERMVEVTLLNDVVHRFRRSVQTQKRIEKLAKINPEDCKLIDDFMTKYSRYEHSQSNELPTPPPDPEEIENDLQELKVWCEEFKARPVAAAGEAVAGKSISHAT